MTENEDEYDSDGEESGGEESDGEEADGEEAAKCVRNSFMAQHDKKWKACYTAVSGCTRTLSRAFCISSSASLVPRSS